MEPWTQRWRSHPSAAIPKQCAEPARALGGLQTQLRYQQIQLDVIAARLRPGKPEVLLATAAEAVQAQRVWGVACHDVMCDPAFP